MRYKEIVTDKQLDDVWGNANFGSESKRDVLKDTLIKVLAGYDTGSAAKFICRQLGLIFDNKWALTSKGRKYIGEYLLEYKSGSDINMATASVKRLIAQKNGYDDFCEAHQLSYNEECPLCADIKTTPSPPNTTIK